MAWIIGIDEAGYGPNLGPLVMTSVACQLPDEHQEADLWGLLATAVRRRGDKDDGRLLVDDSKVVYSTGRGLAGLEHHVLAALWREPCGETAPPARLADFLAWACAGGLADLQAEPWYKGGNPLPCAADGRLLATAGARFEETCARAAVGRWLVRSVVVPTPRFNALLDDGDSKGAVLAHGLVLLLRENLGRLPAGEAVVVNVDKHGGRNTYSAMIHHALPDGLVAVQEEGMARSIYRVLGLGREFRVRIQPRADASCFCVALASMASKYVREALMLEFNHFWRQHVPGLKPTAGYPTDALRFWEAIREAAARLGLTETALWRRK